MFQQTWKMYVVLLCTIISLVTPQNALAKLIQQAKLLVRDSNIAGIKQGYSVAISGGGNTAIIGAPGENESKGAAYIFFRNMSGVWKQQARLVGSCTIGVCQQGFAVGLSDDGGTAIVGSPNANSNKGIAYIYSHQDQSGVWLPQASLFDPEVNDVALQGVAVSLSGDGNTAIVGGYYDANRRGSAWIYIKKGFDVWAKEDKLFSEKYTGLSLQGVSVSLSRNGNIAVIGGHGDLSDRGAVWIFAREPNGKWSEQQKLIAADVDAGAYLGVSVSVSDNGDTVLMGASSFASEQGGAWIFGRNGQGIWIQQAKLTGDNSTGIVNQGVSVSISGNGNTAIVGGFNDNDGLGATWIFRRDSNGNWAQQGSKVVGTGSTPNARQGNSVSLSSNGGTMIIGGFQDNNTVGASWIFTVQAVAGTSAPTQTPTVLNSQAPTLSITFLQFVFTILISFLIVA